MKISNEVSVELKKIKAAVDDAYEKLNVTLHKKRLAAKVSYEEVNPSETVTENFQYISKILRTLQDSERVED